MTHARMLDETRVPTGEEIKNFIGEANFPLWSDLVGYLDHAYGIEPELIFYGKRYGWCVRYRKSSKTLCTLFPERSAFTVLITFGEKELEKLSVLMDSLSEKCRKNLKAAKQFHDGKWYWMPMPEVGALEDIRIILETKRRPRKGT